MTPFWSALPQASASCQELLRCNCNQLNDVVADASAKGPKCYAQPFVSVAVIVTEIEKLG
ncbi:hypothetical protein DPMN_137074 [Dreissena polymorpha]|uniref:Uncharacterized protein n=1 Tax=Dreissena polymorpha TaxID=45954 RepID=A0A9D4JIH3_DREPO|nr:hypothetical protein DPMN_137074 [Dreissena polymorpha]